METNTAIESAKRLARTIASDIALYHEKAIHEGILTDRLFELLAQPIDEGRELYKSRIPSSLYETTDFYDAAIIDYILKGVGESIASPIW